MTTKKHYTLDDLERDFGPFTFGQILEAYRLAEEMTAVKFSRKLGISPQSLCDLEKGRKLPSVSRAAKIARKLKEPIESWVSIALEDQIRQAKLHFKVELKKVS